MTLKLHFKEDFGTDQHEFDMRMAFLRYHSLKRMCLSMSSVYIFITYKLTNKVTSCYIFLFHRWILCSESMLLIFNYEYGLRPGKPKTAPVLSYNVLHLI